MIRCNNCGQELPDEAMFCFKCGTKVEKKLVCTFCGKELPEGAGFCMYCGKAIGSTGIANENEMASRCVENEYVTFCQYEEDPRKFAKNLEMIGYPNILFDDWSFLDGKIYQIENCFKSNTQSKARIYCYDVESNEKLILCELDREYREGIAVNNCGIFCKDSDSDIVTLVDFSGKQINELKVEGTIEYIYDEFIYTLIVDTDHPNGYGYDLSKTRIMEYSIITGVSKCIVDSALIKSCYENTLKNQNNLRYSEYESYNCKADIKEVFVNSSRIYIYVTSYNESEFGHIVIDRKNSACSIFKLNHGRWCNLISNTVWHFKDYVEDQFYNYTNEFIEYTINSDGELIEKENGRVWKGLTYSAFKYFDGDNAISTGTDHFASVFNKHGETVYCFNCKEKSGSWGNLEFYANRGETTPIYAIRGMVKINKGVFTDLSGPSREMIEGNPTMPEYLVGKGKYFL